VPGNSQPVCGRGEGPFMDVMWDLHACSLLLSLQLE